MYPRNHPRLSPRNYHPATLGVESAAIMRRTKQVSHPAGWDEVLAFLASPGYHTNANAIHIQVRIATGSHSIVCPKFRPSVIMWVLVVFVHSLLSMCFAQDPVRPCPLATAYMSTSFLNLLSYLIGLDEPKWYLDNIPFVDFPN